MKAIDEALGDEIEDVEIPIGEGDDEVTPLTGEEWRAATSAIILTVALTVASIYFGGRGMLSRPPRVSIHILAALIPVAVAVWIYAANALRVTRPHEGTVARGLALTSVVLSSLCILLVSWSEFSLVSAQVGR